MQHGCFAHDHGSLHCGYLELHDRRDVDLRVHQYGVKALPEHRKRTVTDSPAPVPSLACPVIQTAPLARPARPLVPHSPPPAEVRDRPYFTRIIATLNPLADLPILWFVIARQTARSASTASPARPSAPVRFGTINVALAKREFLAVLTVTPTPPSPRIHPTTSLLEEYVQQRRWAGVLHQLLCWLLDQRRHASHLGGAVCWYAHGHPKLGFSGRRSLTRANGPGLLALRVNLPASVCGQLLHCRKRHRLHHLS